MNGRKAKAIRRASEDIAITCELPLDKQYYLTPIYKSKLYSEGQLTVRKCAPAIAKRIKKMVKASPVSVPLAVIDDESLRVAFEGV